MKAKALGIALAALLPAAGAMALETNSESSIHVKVVRPDGTTREIESKGSDVKVYEVMPDGTRKPVEAAAGDGKGHYVVEDKGSRLELNITGNAAGAEASASAMSGDTRTKELEARIRSLEAMNKALRRQLDAAGKTLPKSRPAPHASPKLPKDSEAPDAQLGDLGKTLDEALSGIGPEIEKALAAVQPEIEKAMKAAQPEIEKALKSVQPEIEKSMKAAPQGAGPDAAPNQAEIEQHVREGIAEAMKAMAEAMKGIGDPQKQSQ